jgi:hypothetical protein
MVALSFVRKQTSWHTGVIAPVNWCELEPEVVPYLSYTVSSWKVESFCPPENSEVPQKGGVFAFVFVFFGGTGFEIRASNLKSRYSTI